MKPRTEQKAELKKKDKKMSNIGNQIKKLQFKKDKFIK